MLAVGLIAALSPLADASQQFPIHLPDMAISLTFNNNTSPAVYNDAVDRYMERMNKICRAYGEQYLPFYSLSFLSTNFPSKPLDFQQIAVLSEKFLARFPRGQVGNAELKVGLHHPGDDSDWRTPISTVVALVHGRCTTDLPRVKSN